MMKDAEKTIVIEHRFNGPPNSANGGYICGLIAGAIGESVSVRLHRPPPLDTPLTVKPRNGHEWQVLHDEQVIAVAARAGVQAHVPKPPSYMDALTISRQYIGFRAHSFPTCFVCGPQRQIGDGLRIFPGKAANAQLVAAPWRPHESLADALGKVRPEFIWAALDCPGYFASIFEDRIALLGELAVHVDRSVHVEEPCVVIGWRILVEGRKHKVGTALFDEEGERCALGVATWIEAKTGSL